MHLANETWAAQVLNMQVNPQKGPDLIDEHKVAEVKFCLVYPDRYKHKSWKTLGHQLAYNTKEKPAFWALGFYQLLKPIAQIRTKDPKELEELVPERKLYIVEWNWANQFPCRKQEGQTERSQWENHIGSPKFRLLPRTIREYNVQKGIVYITEGVSPEVFNIRTSELS